MHCRVEILNRFADAGDAAELLYAPIAFPLRARESRVYACSWHGPTESMEAFVRDVLVDPVTDVAVWDGDPAVDGFRFFVDVALKPGLLDLEREYLLRFHRANAVNSFRIDAIRRVRRLYFFAEGVPASATDRVIRDVVNPAIHEWEVCHASG